MLLVGKINEKIEYSKLLLTFDHRLKVILLK